MADVRKSSSFTPSFILPSLPVLPFSSTDNHLSAGMFFPHSGKPRYTCRLVSTVGQGVLESGVFRQSFMEEAMEGSVCQVGLLFPCGTCLAGVFLSIKLTHGLTPKHRSGEGGEGGEGRAVGAKRP